MTKEESDEFPRLPQNMPGDFYTTGYLSDGIWCGECLQCMLPEMEAPSLMAEHNEKNDNTYFVKQPETPAEITQAIRAVQVCCVEAVRYGGRNKNIMRQIGPGASDHYPLHWLILNRIRLALGIKR